MCVLLIAVACGGEDDGDAEPDANTDVEVCTPPAGVAAWFDPTSEVCIKLSSYRFFTDGVAQTPNDRVVGYDLNTPLFSDYANKHRFIWLPDGTQITYDADGVFVFPDGAVIIKTFGYLTDIRDPALGERLLETRLLVNTGLSWQSVVYQWNDEQTEATLLIAGAIVEGVSWIHSDGASRTVDYIIPNTNQCTNCHERASLVKPIGPQARHLNRDYDYGAGPVNQLTHLATVGYLTGAPADPTSAPSAPIFDDDATGTVEERARAWLDINCAHCHNPQGLARTSGLDLSHDQTTASQYGVCKTPVAAGAGSGGFQYDIVPGTPDESILVFRIESIVPGIRMPELLRTIVHDESVAVVRQWITDINGNCN